MTGTLVESVREIATAAGRVLLEHYGAVGVVETKADRSPVTAADRAANDSICEALARLTPGVPVVSEEAEASHAVAASEFWLVDPLDGTKEFLRRTGEFTVNVALVLRGAPGLGVVHVPALRAGVTYFASTGPSGQGAGGAFRAEGTAAAERIAVTSMDRAAPRIVASRDHAGPAVQALLARHAGARTLSMGSSLKFCLIAEGRADVYLRDVPTMEWDTAAAQCVVTAAGGQVWSVPELVPLTYGKPAYRNPALVTVGDPSVPWIEMLS